jgi:hypothetical protein
MFQNARLNSMAMRKSCPKRSSVSELSSPQAVVHGPANCGLCVCIPALQTEETVEPNQWHSNPLEPMKAKIPIGEILQRYPNPE